MLLLSSDSTFRAVPFKDMYTTSPVHCDTLGNEHQRAFDSKCEVEQIPKAAAREGGARLINLFCPHLPEADPHGGRPLPPCLR